MSKEEMIDQLISLKHHCLTMDDEIFKDDAKAIEGVLDLVNKQDKVIDFLVVHVMLQINQKDGRYDKMSKQETDIEQERLKHWAINAVESIELLYNKEIDNENND